MPAKLRLLSLGPLDPQEGISRLPQVGVNVQVFGNSGPEREAEHAAGDR